MSAITHPAVFAAPLVVSLVMSCRALPCPGDGAVCPSEQRLTPRPFVVYSHHCHSPEVYSTGAHPRAIDVSSTANLARHRAIGVHSTARAQS